MQTVWRSLSVEEQVLWPQARLGGALAVLVACAAALTLIGFGLIGWGVYLLGPGRSLPDLFGGLFDTLSPARRVGMIYALHAIGLIVWSTLFLVMTLARASSTPMVTSVTFGLHFALGVLAAVFTQFVVAGDSATVANVATGLVSYVPVWLGGLMLTVGLSGYLLGGVRPNAYYRRRVAAPST